MSAKARRQEILAQAKAEKEAKAIVVTELAHVGARFFLRI
jgi:uridine phosphorylase